MALVRKMFRSYKSFFFLTTILFFLASCYQSEKEQGRYFHYNDYSGIASLDPAFAKNQSIMWAVHQLYNTLVEVDSQLNITASVAKNWTVSEDGKLYTFYLRNDVFFHNDPCFKNGKGRRLVAEDVAYSFKRLSDKTIASPGGWIFNNKVDSVNGFTTINDTTFQVRLLKPYHPILGILSMQYCSIVPHEAIEKYGNDFRRHPVGTGPFCIVAWGEGQGFIMKPN
jgi:peptide/nickel transport system substrate-binding protein